jgi:hypothetical protein
MYLWYRESPVLLERGDFLAPWFLYALSPFDPRPKYSGEVTVLLNRDGLLRDFTAVPEQRPASQPSATNWLVLFKAAGLDFAAFRTDVPQWTPLFYGDERVAWVPDADRDDHLVRVEAASFHGRPVNFMLIYPWTVSSRDAGTSRTAAQRTADLVIVLFISSVMLAAVIVARRNLRLDRADKRGAIRLAVGIMSLAWFGWLLDEHHVPAIWQLYLAMLGSGWALLAGTLVGAFYLALEPYVRRIWPATIISWSRAMAGDVRDPLVARDALIGLAVGAAIFTVWQCSFFVTGAVRAFFRRLMSTPLPSIPQHAVAWWRRHWSSQFASLMNLPQVPGLGSCCGGMGSHCRGHGSLVGAQRTRRPVFKSVSRLNSWPMGRVHAAVLGWSCRGDRRPARPQPAVELSCRRGR